MGYNRENYARVKQEYEGKYLRAEDAAKLRRAEVESAVAGVKEINREMSLVGMRTFEASLRGDRAAIDQIHKELAELRQKRADLLVAAGYPADYTEVRYECAECGDTGTVGHRMCRCMKKRLSEMALESSGMKHLVEKQTFENFDLSYYPPEVQPRMKQILGIVKNYANSFCAGESGNVLLMGNTGLGKTHISSAMGGIIMDKGNDVYYATATGMISDFEMHRFGNSISDDVQQETEKYFNCDLLIIDDLGTEVVNQFTTSCLYNVINSRLNRKKSTIINTNFTQDEIRKKYQDRIASRIFGEYLLLPFVGTDIRMIKLNKK